jgi:hypothetical protein
VTKVGEVANTNAPVPVSPVTAAAKLADEGVAKNVPTAVPNPEMPVLTGREVQLDKSPEAGIPRIGVVNVGDVRVLFVRVSVVARPTRVSVEVGRVRVPVLLMEAIIGVVRVLLVRVEVEVVVTSVPEVGTVRAVLPVKVRAHEYAPTVENAPPKATIAPLYLKAVILT